MPLEGNSPQPLADPETFETPHRRRPLLQQQIGLAPDVYGIERAANLELRKRRAEFVLRCGLEKFHSSRRIAPPNLDRGVDGRQPIVIYHSVKAETVPLSRPPGASLGQYLRYAPTRAARIFTSRVDAVASAELISRRESATL